MFPKLSIVICSLNGAAGVDRCINAIKKQTVYSLIELIVVDDGSTDGTSDVARAHEAIVIRHDINLGLAKARNSGLNAASAPIVAFLDDDCEPESKWAEQLLAVYKEGVIGVGGSIVHETENGYILGYLKRNSPFKPQELNLAKSNSVFFRFYLYLRRQWINQEYFSQREVYSFLGGNMSFLRQALIDVGKFDERFSFGGEELDLCMRMRRTFPLGRLIFSPDVQVVHHFKPSLHSTKPSLYDSLRRSRAYGRGSARLYRKWPSMPPTYFPGPMAVLTMLVLSWWVPAIAVAALLMPQLLYPKGARTALASRSISSLPDAYVQLAQETWSNIGFLEGLWRFRHFVPETVSRATDLRERRSLVP